MNSKVRVRFAPSPTGPLHIGGVRTALYNYLFARQHNGDFILRIEDTDQSRYVPEAEAYILESLKWLGIQPDEGPITGGNFGPYRQSERKENYRKYAMDLVNKGLAYYAFDTTEDLEKAREQAKAEGDDHFKYDSRSRQKMKNSLTLSPEKTSSLLDQGHEYVIRLRIEPGENIYIQDAVRGSVQVYSDELDDKVILKSDGMPTYHLANVVDDYLMEISHVIRGEEWLPSTAHHVLLYRYLGWSESMPSFAHLPLILKPTGKGKLSKRDGQKLGIPVFPLNWKEGDDTLLGFKELGFSPSAVLNFLALLGWNPGTDQEIMNLDHLITSFDIEKIAKSGARFDYDKAKWFNQQYLSQEDDQVFVKNVIDHSRIRFQEDLPIEKLSAIILLFKERLDTYIEFDDKAAYMFSEEFETDQKSLHKKYKKERHGIYLELLDKLDALENFAPEKIKNETENVMNTHQLKYGDILPILRLGTTGTAGGPDLFEILYLLGKEKTLARLRSSLDKLQNKL